jgi:hypothetical protein
MGVVDYGLNKTSLYNYTSYAFASWVNFTALQVRGVLGATSETNMSSTWAPATTTTTTATVTTSTTASSTMDNETAPELPDAITVQQNLVDTGVASGKNIGSYWTQDVVLVNQTAPNKNFTVYPISNIWNVSSANAKMSSKVNGNMTGMCDLTGGVPKFYYCASSGVKMTLPFSVRFVTITGTMSNGTYKGDSYVNFYVGVYQNNALKYGVTFDKVIFNSNATNTPVFKVGGKSPNNISFNDAETVLAGPGSSSIAILSVLNATISESYFNSSDKLVSVPHAWSAGSNTAELVMPVGMSSKISGTGIAQVSVASANNTQLW